MFNSLQQSNDVEKQGLNNTANNINNSQVAILIIHRFDNIIKTQNKNEIGYIGKQGQLLIRFKDNGHFFDDVGQSRSSIYFKISLYKFLKKYSLLRKVTLQSSYLIKLF